MTQILKPGHNVTCETSGRQCRVVRRLGEGAQGEVYRADLDGQPVALKWYFAANATTEQRAALEVLTRRGAPSARFLWPIEIASQPGDPSFGYVMPLRDDAYKGITDLMRRTADPSFRALVTAAFTLADSFLALHSRGFSYRDINFNNVFFHPDTGDVVICDNDNVAVDGTASAVYGTPGFMAPEIVRMEAPPSIQTDLFSLAVLLFYMFFIEHPLHGRREHSIRCFDLPARQRLYGSDPLFMFDPNNRSNEPVPGAHDNAIACWPLFPRFLRELFVRAFTDGLRDPLARVREGEWKKAMVRLRDSIVYCGCGKENFCDTDAVARTPAPPSRCWACRGDLVLPFQIRLGGRDIVMLNHDTRLFAHHVMNQDWDFAAALAEVTRHPKDQRVWGLKNVSSTKWVAIAGDGAPHEVDPGQSVSLRAGTRIQFGCGEGEIVS